MDDLISVIVPIYKVEPYLRKCLDSICTQTYENLEIILVDDGSPDGCGAICDEYAAKDGRIKVIHKPNGGLSDARNAGLEIMTGDYVAFVDSDDWTEAAMYQKLLEYLHLFDADIAFGGVVDDLEQNGTVTAGKTSNYGENPFSENKTAAMKRYFHGSWAAWDKLYKAELFDEIRYPVGEINEDEAIVLQLLDRCKTVCYTNEIFYHYIRRLNGQSITTSSFSTKKLAWPKHCRNNLAFIRENYPELELDAASRYRGSLLWALTEIAVSEGDYSAAAQSLLKELRQNAAVFHKAPFHYPKDRLRLRILLWAPFPVYRMLVRWKGRWRHG